MHKVSRKAADAAARRRALARGVVVETVNRDRIIRRDNATCYMCGRKPGLRFIVIDHVIPITRGGSHTEHNMKVACIVCNLRKGNRLLEECGWLRHLTGELVIKKHHA